MGHEKNRWILVVIQFALLKVRRDRIPRPVTVGFFADYDYAAMTFILDRATEVTTVWRYRNVIIIDKH